MTTKPKREPRSRRKTTGGRESLVVRLAYYVGLEDRPDLRRAIAEAARAYPSERATEKALEKIDSFIVTSERADLGKMLATARRLSQRIGRFREANPGDDDLYRFLDRVRATLLELEALAGPDVAQKLRRGDKVDQTAVNLARWIAGALDQVGLSELRDDVLEEVFQLDNVQRIIERAFDNPQD